MKCVWPILPASSARFPLVSAFPTRVLASFLLIEVVMGSHSRSLTSASVPKGRAALGSQLLHPRAGCSSLRGAARGPGRGRRAPALSRWRSELQSLQAKGRSPAPNAPQPARRELWRGRLCQALGLAWGQVRKSVTWCLPLGSSQPGDRDAAVLDQSPRRLPCTSQQGLRSGLRVCLCTVQAQRASC